MRPPIIIDNKGEILFFETAQDAETCLEPLDVRNNEYIAYDGSGNKLEIIIRGPEDKKGWLRRLLFPAERTELREGIGNDATMEELKAKLMVYIARLEELKNDSLSRDLSNQIDKAKNALNALEQELRTRDQG